MAQEAEHPHRAYPAGFALRAARSYGDGRAVRCIAIRLEDVSAAIGLDPAKAAELVRLGAIPTFTVDGCRLVRTLDLIDFIDAMFEAEIAEHVADSAGP